MNPEVLLAIAGVLAMVGLGLLVWLVVSIPAGLGIAALIRRNRGR